jgi:hypothetical protein
MGAFDQARQEEFPQPSFSDLYQESPNLISGSIADRLSGVRYTMGGLSGHIQWDAPRRRVYALGCWLALESIHDRLIKGNAFLCQMRDQGLTDTKRFDRLSLAWLKLGFKAIALIGRMAKADAEIEAQFCASPTGHYFAAEPWPNVPAGVDIESLLVKPAQIALGVM